MKSKMFKFSVILSLITAAVPMAAQAQVVSGSVPVPQSQIDYWQSIWKDSNDYAKAAELSYYKGQYKEAEKLCQKSTDKAPLTPDGKSHQGNWQAGDVLAMVYIREQKYAEAIKVYDDLHASYPTRYRQSSLEQLNLALCYLRLGKYDEARLHYRNSDRTEARPIGTNDPPVSDYPGTDTPTKLEASILMNRGGYMAAYGSESEGLIDLRRAHKLMPDNPIIADWLADALSGEEHYAERIELYKIVVKNGHGKSMLIGANAHIPYNNGN